MKGVTQKLTTTIKRWWNWLRIKGLSYFTNRVKQIEITDQKGKKHKITTEQKYEKVCQHKHLEQIANTMWKCMDCDDAYFQIGYKVLLSYNDFVSWLDSMANFLKKDLNQMLEDKKEDERA